MHPQRDLIEAAQQIADNIIRPYPSSFFANKNFHQEHSEHMRSSPEYRAAFDEHMPGDHNDAHFNALAAIGKNSRFVRKPKKKAEKFYPKVEKPKDPQGRLFPEPPPPGHPDI